MNDDDPGNDERLQGRKADEVDVVALPEAPSSRTIWVLFLAGPTIWFTHFMVVYLLAEWICLFGRPERELWGLPLVSTLTVVATVAAVIVIAVFAVVAYRRWRQDEELVRSQRDEQEELAAARGRDRTLAFGGFILGMLFIGAVLVTGAPALWLSPC